MFFMSMGLWGDGMSLEILTPLWDWTVLFEAFVGLSRARFDDRVHQPCQKLCSSGDNRFVFGIVFMLHKCHIMRQMKFETPNRDLFFVNINVFQKFVG